MPSLRSSVHTIDCDVLPTFTAAYLRVDGDECAFVEAHTARALPRLIAALEAHGRRPEDVRWIVVTHAHLDHAAGAGSLLARCPNATLLAHPRAAAHLTRPEKLIASATRVYGEERFTELYGEILPIPEARVQSLDDGATFPLGRSTLRVHHTLGHARHHFVVEDPALDTVYTGDAFGLVYPALQGAGRFALASSSPIDFDAHEARRSIDRILALGTATAHLTHFGPVDDVATVGAQVRAWIDRSEAWQEEAARGGGTVDERVAAVAAKVRAALVALGRSPEDLEHLAMDIDLNAQGIVVAADRAARRTA